VISVTIGGEERLLYTMATSNPKQLQKRIQGKLNTFLAPSYRNNNRLTLRAIKNLINWKVSSIDPLSLFSTSPPVPGTQKPEVCVKELIEFIDTIDLDINTETLAIREPIQVLVPSSYRHWFNFPSSIISDIVFGNIKLTLRSVDDLQLMIECFKNYLFGFLLSTLSSKFLADESELLCDVGVSQAKIIKASSVYRTFLDYYQACGYTEHQARIKSFRDAQKFFTVIVSAITANSKPQWESDGAYIMYTLPRSELKQVVTSLSLAPAAVSTLAEKLTPKRREPRYRPSAIRVTWKRAIQLTFLPILLVTFIGETVPFQKQRSGDKQSSTIMHTKSPGTYAGSTSYPYLHAKTKQQPIEKNKKSKSEKKVEIKKSSAPPEQPGNELHGLFYFEDESVDFKNKIHLTFDDGPNLEQWPGSGSTCVTNRILDILSTYDIKATFFINGKNLLDNEGNPIPQAQAILERIINEGHIIANHSFNHHNLAQDKYNDHLNDYREIRQEIASTQKIVDRILGYHYPLHYFRPPYAEAGRNAKVDKITKELGLYMIMFQIDSFDYRVGESSRWNPEYLLQKLNNNIESGSGGTILFHERLITAHMLPKFLDTLPELSNEHGHFTFTTLPALLKVKYGSPEDKPHTE
jgi:peptidoglycan/xylan/chitin deacetylase (PgdA/CDA1 family)